MNGWQLTNTNYISRRLQLNIPHFQQILAFSGLILLAGYSLTVFKLPTSGPIFEPISRALNISPLPSWKYPLYDPAGWTVGYAITGHFPSQQDYENGWKIIERVNQTEGLLMSEDAGFSFQSGREVITNGVQLKNLWENDAYDPAELIQYIENHEFGLIILRADLFPSPVLIAIKTYYELDEVIPMNGFDYQLWQPIESPPASD